MKSLCFGLVALSITLFAQEEIALQNPLNSAPEADLQIPVPKFELPPHKSSFVATGLSALTPGLGHFYLGDSRTGSALLGTAGLCVALAQAGQLPASLRSFGSVGFMNVTFYGIYAAYRDARLFNRNSGYKYHMPTDSLADLTLAPFNYRVLKKPEVWGGLFASLGLAMGVSYIHYKATQSIPIVSSSVGDYLSPALAFPIGIGEESLFRGFMQPMLAEGFTPAGGIALTSLLFGAAHIPNAQALPAHERWSYYCISLPLITLLGAYDGWVSYKYTSLQESVALHTWYDFALFSLYLFAAEATLSRNTAFAIYLSF